MRAVHVAMAVLVSGMVAAAEADMTRNNDPPERPGLEVPRQASSGERELETLAEEIDDLRTRNDALAERLDETDDKAWLDEERTAEIRSIVQDVISDSRMRTSLQAAKVQAGYTPGNGFFLGTEDQSFTLRIDGQIQVRWVLNHNGSGQDYDVTSYIPDVLAGTNTRAGPKTGWGFGVRRAKVRFQGNVFDPTWTYQVNGAFGRTTGTFSFEEATISKDLGSGFGVTLGQMKTPFLREELVSSRNQLAVDRSLVNAFFNQDRGVGAELEYMADDWMATVYYGNGSRTAIDSSQRYTNWASNPTRWAFAGRLQYKIAGDWSDFTSFTSTPGQDTAVMVGVAAMGQQYNGGATFGTIFGVAGIPSLVSLAGNLDGSKVYGVTADVSAKFGSVSLFAAFVWQQYSIEGSGTLLGAPVESFSLPTTNPWGFVVQGGYSLTEKLELYGRYSYANADLDDVALTATGLPAPFPPTLGPIPIPLGQSNLSVITIGVNYFLNDNTKVSVDWGINLESTLLGVDEGSLEDLGWNFTNTADQWVLRAQIQLLF